MACAPSDDSDQPGHHSDAYTELMSHNAHRTVYVFLVLRITSGHRVNISRVVVVCSPFSIVIISLGDEIASLCTFRAFVCLVLFLHALIFVLLLFLFVSGVDCGLWLWHSLDCSLHFFVWQVCIQFAKYVCHFKALFENHNNIYWQRPKLLLALCITWTSPCS